MRGKYLVLMGCCFLMFSFAKGDVNPGLPFDPSKLTGDGTPEGKAVAIQLTSFILPKVDFNGLDIEQVLGFLIAQSKQLDPKHVGVRFRLDLPRESDSKPSLTHRKVSITLNDVPLGEVLAYACIQVNLSYKIVKDTVVLYPRTP